jgi:hypothetical protein
MRCMAARERSPGIALAAGTGCGYAASIQGLLKLVLGLPARQVISYQSNAFALCYATGLVIVDVIIHHVGVR